jgi:hypothetical protein
MKEWMVGAVLGDGRAQRDELYDLLASLKTSAAKAARRETLKSGLCP